MLAGWDGQVRGAVAVADTVKPSAAAAVAGLRRLGLRTVLLTGDSQATAQAVAAEAGTDEVIAGALPGHKVAVIRDLQARATGWPWSATGSTTGPPWPRPTWGWPSGTGTDVAISAADLILLRDDLGAVPDAIALARGHAGDDPGQPRLGVRLQHRRDPAGGRRVPQPADRGGGDGRVVGVRRGQQRAAAAVRRPGRPPPLAAAAPCRTCGTRADKVPAGGTEPVEAEEQVA